MNGRYMACNSRRNYYFLTLRKSSAIKQINKQFFLSNSVNRFNTFTGEGGGEEWFNICPYTAFKLLRGQACTFDWTWSWYTLCRLMFFHPNTSHDFRVHPSNKFSPCSFMSGLVPYSPWPVNRMILERAMKLKEWTSI